MSLGLMFHFASTTIGLMTEDMRRPFCRNHLQGSGTVLKWWESNSPKISISDTERLKWRMKLTPKEKPTLGVCSLIELYNYEVVTLAIGSQHKRWLVSFSANVLCSVILSDSKQSLDSEEKTGASGAMYKWWIKMADVLEPKPVLENMWDVGRNHTCTLIWAHFGRTSYKQEL